ncbi:MAG: acetyl-CoA carboxylase biotin carboxylase subunit [Deltaproteobacteria bacterium RBG_13_52_11b]|nr:MAG: acetyl-CoA carboxylase biotin carboxylase subunit [Deltaproteobacteria bacterium RBG_13_52_11b]
MTISRIFIANRGEIAVRIIKACKALGVETCLAVSEADRESMAARMADRTVCIGPPRAQESYLKVNTIVSAARGTGCQALHPGYGFLAENPELPKMCSEQGIIFIGPPEHCIREMGNKLLARKLVKGYGIPVIPGSEKVRDVKEAADVAKDIGFPVILKAAAGGGGRGIKVITEPRELTTTFETAAAEARAAFGDDVLYMEKYILRARHIEVQILGDSYGNVIHLGERDCSIQRHYQKVIEESPAPALSDTLRAQIQAAAVTIARSIGYQSAGTVEFVFDKDTQAFYFLEMNTRIQVEHPVTEMVSGVDIVKEQIRIADGKPMGLIQSRVSLSGHAIECRLTAEAPERDFAPSPGKVTEWVLPEGPGIRIDTHCHGGYIVTPYYDSLLAKVITVGKDRMEAIDRMTYALGHFSVKGVDTVIPFLLFVLAREEYKKGDVHTRWLEGELGKMCPGRIQ